MNIFLIIAGILQALATVSRNPELGIGNDNAGRYAELLEFLARLVERGQSAITELQALRVEVKDILLRGTPPTDDEIERWKARSDAAHAELQGMKSEPEEPTG
jgi:hypothetical protein